MAKSRSAEATIRGFNFQFAATILLILKSENDTKIVVEGVEDVDLDSANEMEAVQCKYFEGTKLTNSVLRDIVKPMLSDDKIRSKKINYHIYGHFKEKVEFPLGDAVKFRADVLVYAKGKKEKKVASNVADDLSISNKELASFLKRLSFTYTKKYDTHRDDVIKVIRDQMNCSLDEAKSLFYPNAFTLVAELGTRPAKANRTIKKSEFLSQINSKQIVFHQWLMQEQEEGKYCKTMRRNYFTQSNVSPSARFFVIECDGSESIACLKALVSEISRKWSSHKKRRLESKDRYSPYLLLQNLPSGKLVQLKSQLFAEGIKLVDGFPFLDSGFNPEHVNQVQTLENQIALRFLSDAGQLHASINAITSRNCEIYEFYQNDRLAKSHSELHVQIPVSNISQIKKIV